MTRCFISAPKLSVSTHHVVQAVYTVHLHPGVDWQQIFAVIWLICKTMKIIWVFLPECVCTESKNVVWLCLKFPDDHKFVIINKLVVTRICLYRDLCKDFFKMFLVCLSSFGWHQLLLLLLCIHLIQKSSLDNGKWCIMQHICKASINNLNQIVHDHMNSNLLQSHTITFNSAPIIRSMLVPAPSSSIPFLFLFRAMITCRVSL